MSNTVNVTTTKTYLTVEDTGQRIEVVQQTPSVVTVGIPGPQGPQGASGGVYVQDSTPVGTSGELWFSDTTNELKVYASGSWQTQTLNDGYF